MEYVICPICKVDDSIKLFEMEVTALDRETFPFVKCKRCGLVYINPRPSFEEISKYYNNDYFSFRSLQTIMEGKGNFINRLQFRILNEIVSTYSDNIYKNWSKKLKKALFWFVKLRYGGIPSVESKGKILEIGGGDGIFLYVMKRYGWETHGVEINKTAVKTARKYGLNVRYGTIFQGKYPSGYFDVVRLWHVLEHLHNPYETLIETRRILRKDGTLIIGVPNINSFVAKLFKERWSGWDVPIHLYHFSKDTITELLNRTGFDQVRINFQSISTIQITLERMSLNKFYLTFLRSIPIRFAFIAFDHILDCFKLSDGLEIFAQSSG